MERSLNSTASTPVFKAVTSGLEEGITLKKLWMQGNSLWTVDTSHNKLLIYTDTVVSPLTLISPTNGAPGLEAENTTLGWEQADGATGYNWQINTAADFSNTAGNFEGSTASSTVTLTSLDSNTTYYWRVRAIEPAVSPWSAVRSFDTLKLETPKPSSPVSSSSAVIEPVFKWSVCAGAEQYELLVSLNDNFTNLAISRICSANVWQSDVTLKYNTGYYWRVRAQKDTVYSDWSAVNYFTTKNSSSGSSSSGGGSSASHSSTTATRTVTVTPAAAITPAPTTIPSPSPAVTKPENTTPTTQAAAGSIATIDPTFTAVPAASAEDVSNRTNAPVIPIPTSSNAPKNQTDSPDPVLLSVICGLAALTILMGAGILYLLKKPKI